jgi:cation:H+ antiporter
MGIYVIAGAATLHFVSIALLGRLPQWLGVVLLGGYATFIYTGVAQA